MDITEFKKTYEHKKVIENNNQIIQNPVVSVCIQTYQHVNYIEQCLDGILMQKTDFNYEILLGEDASTDGTREICMDYANRFPDKIRLFLHHRENNIKIGGQPTGRFNFLYNLYLAQGKYIALCEGDDYWTNPLKLQKQVDFLEGNEEYVMCFHKVVLLSKGELIEDNITKVPKDHEMITDLAEKGNYIHTPSVMFKGQNLDFPNEFRLSPIGDFFLYMLLAKNGKIGYINEKMTVYRLGSGIWSNKTAYERNMKTVYTFALLIKTNLFSEKVNQILLYRIRSFLKRFKDQLDLESLTMLTITPSIRNTIYQFFLDSTSQKLIKKNDDLTYKQLINGLKMKAFKKLKSIFN
ncbi:glycosyltransferase [Psychroflexus sp. CAK1W]|uniref:glycosyltransferase family 2 protein n=1 Tax=Psychroflexus curvus TaxID=2873595 RepID=UPI001CCDBD96|nr:glycosyltransferase [Psychroflexus curvus]MBZ9628899.1 glycosyltransferase [Psychroflexus curvus]